MVEDAFGKTQVEGQPVRRGEIDPRLPFLGAGVIERLRRDLVVHRHPPADGEPLCGGFDGGSVAHFEPAAAEIAVGLPSRIAACKLRHLSELRFPRIG